MYSRALWLIPCLALVLTGCGPGTIDDSTRTEAPAENRDQVTPPVETSLESLLEKPRSELAERTEELLTQVRIQEKAHREGRLAFPLIPELRLPIVLPVLREAKYSEAAGFSLPPYSTGSKDSILAEHLARYGDVEAAKRLAPADASDVQRTIDKFRFERNYSVEWTRLVGLLLHAAQLRLAAGEADGLTELIALHQQLLTVLDAKAQQGPLGAALLGRGRRALTWALRSGKKITNAIVGEEALTNWGKLPSPVVGVVPGATRAELARLLGDSGVGKAIVVKVPQQALDLLDLPLAPEGVQSVITCFDRTDRLTEVVVLYRPGIALTFPEPRQLAFPLEEFPIESKDGRGPGIVRRTYTLPQLTCEVGVITRSDVIGAFARLSSPQMPPLGPLPRDFGLVQLDRGFEQNRQRLAPDQMGFRVQSDRAATLAQVHSPIQGVPLIQTVVYREDKQDLVSRFTFRHRGEGGLPPLHHAALKLWASGGPAHFSGQEDDNGGHLALTWEDELTRAVLRLPFSGGAIMELEIEDARNETALTRRAEIARNLDRTDRRKRMAEGKALTRLPRFLDKEEVRLGQTRDQITAMLPEGPNVIRHQFGDGIGVVVMGEAPKDASYLARQMFVRFDNQGKAVELRTRYAGAAKVPNWTQSFMAAQVKRCGAPAEAPGPWAKMWPELPATKTPPVLAWWQDDLTLVTCQRDAWGIEMVLRDASTDNGSATPMAAFQYLPRGPVEVSLGETREEVLKRAGEKPETIGDGALVVPSRAAAYDSILVWFDEEDFVNRIVTRYRRTGAEGTAPSQMAQRLNESWAQEVRILGWPRRYDQGKDKVLQSLGWHDEKTRIRHFWQFTQNGPPALFSEWRDAVR